MILRSIELESFGRFRNRTVEFRRGMNLVIGPNEAGKSTLAEAVPAVLFGTNHLEKYKTWGRNACSAALFFEGGGRTIKVKRDLITDEVKLVEKDDLYHVLSEFSGKAPLKGRSASCREYRSLVEALLGVGDDKLFRATYFFGHYPQEWTGDDLAQNLRTLVSGTAEVDYADILDGLLDEHFSLTCSNPWGRDKQKPREYEEVCEALENAGEIGPVPVFVEIDDKAELSQQVEALSAEIVTDRLEHEKGVRYIEQVRRKCQVKAEASTEPESVADKPLPKPTSDEKIEDQLAAVGLPVNLPKELPQILAEAGEIRQEMAEFQQPYALLSNREKRIPVVPWPMLGTGIAACALGAGVAWWLSFHALWVVSVAILAASVMIGWGSWKQIGRKKAQDDCQQQRKRLDQKKAVAQSRQTELSERCEALGLPSSPIDLVRLQKLVSTHSELLERYWSGDVAPAHTEPQRQSTPEGEPDKPCSSDDDVSDETVSEETAQELQELESRMAEFEAALKEKETRLEALQKQLNSLPRNGEMASDSGRLLRRKHEIEERLALLRKSINLLAGAVDEFGKSHLVKLNEEAGRMFEKMTSGRYRELRLDDNMMPAVKVDGRRWMSVDNFSRGTVDAIYLAFRIALSKVRGDGRSLPLMLDDPFVHLDHKRLSKTLNLVDLASADGQLILFSHNLELGKRAAKERWHVVPLDDDAEEINQEDEGGENAGQLHLL